MAELSLTCPTTATSTAGGGAVDVDRRILVRTGGNFSANTPLDITSPGTGWLAFGDDVTFSGASDFVDQTQIYRGGQLLLAAESASDDYDVYFVAVSGTLAFESNVRRHDVIQVWRFNATASG